MDCMIKHNFIIYSITMLFFPTNFNIPSPSIPLDPPPSPTQYNPSLNFYISVYPPMRPNPPPPMTQKFLFPSV